MKIKSQKRKVFSFEGEEGKFSVIVDEEKGVAMAYEGDKKIKFEVESKFIEVSIISELKRRNFDYLYERNKNKELEKFIDVEKTAKEIFSQMSKSPISLTLNLSTTTSEIIDKLKKYEPLTEETLSALWDIEFEEYIGLMLLDKVESMKRKNIFKYLLVKKEDEKTKETIEYFIKVLEGESLENKKEKSKLLEEIKKEKPIKERYDDGAYFDFYYNLSNYGAKRLLYDNQHCMVVQIKEDLSFARIVKPNRETKEINTKEFLELVKNLNSISKATKFI